MQFADLPYRLGLPAWAFPGWKGEYWSARPSALASYSRVFQTVEGNTTFYGVPDAKSVAAWLRDVQETGFEFCFKLPRTVTHDRPVSDRDLTAFLRVIEPLGEHLGPLLVQFPARVGPANLSDIDALLTRLPADLRCAVEVRHPQFFVQPEHLNELLTKHLAARVVMDTQALFQGDLQHPEVLRALHEKPDLPVLRETLSGLAFVRIVLHPEPRYNERIIQAWAARVASYVREGIPSYIMIHCPNNQHCPAFARDFHNAVLEAPDMTHLPAFPAWPLPQQGSLL